MVWITKTIFVGSDGNKTIEINESTTYEFADKKRCRQLLKWYEILVEVYKNNEIGYDLPNGLFNLIPVDEDELCDFHLDMIQFTLKMKNKYGHPQIENSFSIEVYEHKPFLMIDGVNMSC